MLECRHITGFAKFQIDSFEPALQIAGDVRVPEAENAITLCVEPSLSG